MSTPEEVKFQLDLPVGVEWPSIELLRTALLNCLSAIFANSDFCDAVSMTSGELLENACKYGDWSASKTLFRMRVAGDSDRVTVEVSNPVSDLTGAEEVVKTVRWIKSMPSVEEAFSVKLQAIAQENTGSSGLGLVRIAYEGGCSLDATVAANQVLTVRATCTPT